jgi:RNA polymerase sigma-70 factor (ECF subfamily)
VLREVFDFGYDEVAQAVGKSRPTVRQIAHRARQHVAERRPREAVSTAETRDALAAFQRAVETGDLQGLVDILAPDVVALGDGGGIKQLATRPVAGAEKVANMLELGLKQYGSRLSVEPVQVNAHPALLLCLDGEIDGIVTLRVEGGLISGLYYLRNPEKLTALRQRADSSPERGLSVVGNRAMSTGRYRIPHSDGGHHHEVGADLWWFRDGKTAMKVAYRKPRE